jgi:MFS family permease
LFTTASLGLALQNGYAALLTLRCIQSLGASAIVSIVSAVVADIVVPAERGSYMGFTMIEPILGPSLAPVLGGLLSHYGNWRVTFWSLTGFGALLFLLVIPFLPETCHAVVGDGSYTPLLYQDSYSNWRMRRRQHTLGQSPESKSFNLMTLLGMLAVVSDFTSVLILLLSGFVSAGFWCITTSLPTEYVKIYHFNDLIVGLCYLPMAAGGLLVTLVVGKWDPIDRNYRRHARRLGISFQENMHQEMPNHASQKARIEVATPLLLASIMFAVAYGWSLERHCIGCWPAGIVVRYQLLHGGDGQSHTNTAHRYISISACDYSRCLQCSKEPSWSCNDGCKCQND